MKRTVLYLRVSTVDQHPETQLLDLRQMAAQRGYYVSVRENIDTGGPLGRAIVVIIAAIAELECNLIIERVRAGKRRARLEGTHIGRQPLTLDHEAIQRDAARDRASVITRRAIASRRLQFSAYYAGVLLLRDLASIYMDKAGIS